MPHTLPHHRHSSSRSPTPLAAACGTHTGLGGQGTMTGLRGMGRATRLRLGGVGGGPAAQRGRPGVGLRRGRDDAHGGHGLPPLGEHARPRVVGCERGARPTAHRSRRAAVRQGRHTTSDNVTPTVISNDGSHHFQESHMDQTGRPVSCRPLSRLDRSHLSCTHVMHHSLQCSRRRGRGHGCALLRIMRCWLAHPPRG